MVRTLLAVVLVLFAARGVAAAYPPDPAPADDALICVASLATESAGMSLPGRVERAFLLTLHAADDALRRGDIPQAITLLRTFAFEVRGVKRSKRLGPEAADTLIAHAEDVIEALRRSR